MKAIRSLLPGVIAIIVFFGIQGCKKDENKPKGDYTLLTQHKWKVVATKWIAEDGTERDADVAECRADDLREYETTGKYNLHVGGNLCYDEEISRSGTWELKNYSKVLHMYVEGVGYYDEQVKELSETALKIQYEAAGNTIEETYAPVK